jgi:hypothetical protein
MKITLKTFPLLLALVLILVATSAAAQTPGAAAPAAEDSESLAKQLSNPVASVVSVPFQMNWDNGLGPGKEQTRFLLNFQPVMPFSINEDWNLIARVIVPFLSQPPLAAGAQPTSGVSDLLFTAFVSPAVPKGFIWGVGPALVLPATADPFLGGEKWAVGPSIVVLKQIGPWTAGALFNQLWSYAGNSARADVNQTYLQPFLSYTTKTAVTVGVSSESSGNWEAASGHTWTVPILVNASKLVRLGRRPMSIGVAGGGYASKPDGGSSWKFRSSITLLFPK